MHNFHEFSIFETIFQIVVSKVRENFLYTPKYIRYTESKLEMCSNALWEKIFQNILKFKYNSV